MTIQSRVATVLMVLLTPALVALAMTGTLGMGAAVALSLGLLGLAVLGRVGMAALALCVAFGTAPMYRGIGGIANVATPTDLFMVMGIFLLLPEVLSRKNRLPAIFTISVFVLGGVGLIASAANASPVTSVIYMLQWLLCLAVLPAVLVFWSPSARMINGLLWCYLGGQALSTAMAFVRGPAGGPGRYQGLSHHPNDFGLAAAAAIAIVFFLFPRMRSLQGQLLLGMVMLLNVVALIMSGSRGATLAAAAVIVIVPLVERSAVLTFLGGLFGAIGLALLPTLIKLGGPGSSLGRLAGDATSAGSDSVREAALTDGWHRFLADPFFGTGLDPIVGAYHNLFLESAVAVGVLGTAAYLVALWVLTRPLLGTLSLRRLSYLSWIFIVSGITFPGIVDRTIVVPMALALLAAVERPPAQEATDTEPAGTSFPVAIR